MSRYCLTCRLAASFLAAASAQANDTNYQNYLVGERALGLGGAFTALADDASGAFYNPAGLAWVPTSSLSGSLNVYGIERQTRTRAYTDELDGKPVSIDLEDAPISTIPTTVGLVRKLGPKLADGIARHALGFSTYVPYASEFAAGARLQGSTSAGHYEVSEKDKTIWMGPTYALRILPRLALGVSAFYGFRDARNSWSRSNNRASATDPDLSSAFTVEDEGVSWNSGELFGRLGTRYQVNEHMSLGLAITTPSVHVHGKARMFQLAAVANDSGILTHVIREATGLATRNALPTSFRLGAAYQQADRFTLSADLSLVLPVSFEPVDFTDLPKKEQPVVLGWVRNIDRETVLNANVGGEYYAWNRVPLRLGFFTNFSSAPDVTISPTAQLTHINMFGFSTSVGVVSESYEVSIGVLYAFGSGEKSAVNDLEYTPEPIRNDFVYFYITGAKKVLSRLARSVVQPQNRASGAPSK